LTRRIVIAFLTDNNVPDSVGEILKARGHSVVRIREIMPVDSPDTVVAEAAIHSGQVLISWDKDFMQQRFLKERFATLQRVAFSCPEPQAAARLTEVLDRIEDEYRRAKKARKALLFRVGRDRIMVRC
jgi:predicted nuclease of predicted toxin-antitoxin system